MFMAYRGGVSPDRCRLPGERDHFRAGFAMKMGPPVCHLMGPPGWRFASYGTTPAWLRGLPVVGPLYWPNELPGGVGDRDRGDAAAVAAGVGIAGSGPAIGD